jgi:hypothetical protein
MEFIDQFMAGDGWQKWVATAAILIIGYFISLLLRGLVSGAINRTGIGKKAKTSGGNIGKSVGKAVFWLALLYTLFLGLSRAGLGEYFGPVENLFDSIAAFIPNLIGGGFIFFIGFIVAKVAGNATSSVLEAAQVDNLVARTGVTEATGAGNSLAKGLGTLVFILVIVPVAIAALGALKMEEISAPLSNMLEGFTGFIPEIIGASAVLAISIFIGRFASKFLADFLPTVGFDNSMNSIMMLDDGEAMKTSPSKAAGFLVFIIALVVGLSAAVDILGVDSLSNAFGTVQDFGGSLLRAAILIGIGVFLANFMGRFMGTMMNPKLAAFVKYFAMVLFVFLGLSSLDPEGQIVPVAFSAFVISASVAAAIAFGLGGREWAKQVLNKTVPPAGMTKLGSKKK